MHYYFSCFCFELSPCACYVCQEGTTRKTQTMLIQDIGHTALLDFFCFSCSSILARDDNSCENVKCSINAMKIKNKKNPKTQNMLYCAGTGSIYAIIENLYQK